MRWDIVVGIATWLRGGRFGVRNLAEETGFCLLLGVQTPSGARQVFYSMHMGILYRG
jgi:hypothetical protein